MIAVAAEQNESNIVEIYDPQADFEKTSTVFTVHSKPINCLAEHRKFLLTGS